MTAPANVLFVAEGWWSPNVKAGQVHDHPTNPARRNWSAASHRACEPVYTRRDVTA